jgi:5-methylthioadenosine/S-adenosylhomocysteine deaminase
MFSEMRAFRLFAKEARVPMEKITASRVIAAATADAAGVLGLPCGELAAGKAADCVFLELDVTTSPMPAAAVNIVHSFNARHVRHVLIGGKWALWERAAVQLSEADAQAAYDTAVREIKRRAGL